MTEQTTETSNFWDGVEVIHRYTRAQAIGDGVLVDVSETAAEAGITVPVALTRALHAEVVSWKRPTPRSRTRRVGRGTCW